MTRWKVNIRLLPVKAHYFFYCAAAAALTPFLPVIGKQMGISQVEIGIIYAVAAILGIIAKPMIGILADRLKKRKNFFLFSILFSFISSLCITFISQGETQHPVIFECGPGVNYIRQCNDRKDLSCTDAFDSLINQRIEEEQEIHNLTSQELGEMTIENSKQELCHVRCNIHGFLEGKGFCRSLNVDHLPKMCEDKKWTTSSSVENGSSARISKAINLSSINVDKEMDSFEEPQPYQLEFDVLIKISKAELVVDDTKDSRLGCLFLPIDEIGFGKDPKEFQKFSCFTDDDEMFRLKHCFMECPNNTGLNDHLERILSAPEDFQSTTFWLFGILVIISLVSLAVVNSLSDALCFQLLGNKPHLYGRQRQLAAVGWGGSTLIAGYLIDRGSQDQLLKDYTPCFYMLGGLFVLDLIMSYKWEIKEDDKPKSMVKNMWSLVSDMRIIVFFVACVLVGMCTGIHWNFLFWLVEDVAIDFCDTLRWLKLLQGLMVAVQCLAEIPFFYYSGWFIKKLGHVNCLSLVLGAFGTRLIIYSYLTHPWAFVPVEMFQGITFGLFYSVMATYASQISPPGTQATVQGIVGAGFEGIGIALGSFIAGVLFKNWGGKSAYRIFGVGALIFCVIHVLLMYFLGKKRTYGIPISDTEIEGQEMYKVNGVAQDVDVETESE